MSARRLPGLPASALIALLAAGPALASGPAQASTSAWGAWLPWVIAAAVAAALALGYVAGAVRAARSLPRIASDIGQLAAGAPLPPWDPPLSRGERLVRDALARAAVERADAGRRNALAADRAHFDGEKAALERLAAGLAGRFGQVLAAARTAVAAAEKAARGDDPGGTRCAADLALAGQALDQAAGLVAGLRRLAPGGDLPPPPVPLATAVERAVASRRSRAARLGATLTLAVDRDAGKIPVDPAATAGALGPLVDNALDALEANGQGQGRVEIRVSPAERGARVTVDDDGPGLAADAAERVFDPFFTTRATGDGLGLGLILARAAASRGGGRIELSPGPLGGTRATVVIAPAAAHASRT